MSKSSVLLLSDTSGELNVTGRAVKADGWFGFADGRHTVGFYLNQFVGRLWVEATLASEPNESDWFPVVFEGQNEPYVEFLNGSPGNGLKVYNFTGNFVYVRGVIGRSHMTPVPSDPLTVGNVKKALLNY